MRTKVLLCLAALAAGIASSSAQVYSLNVVGYINVTIPANGGRWMIANQLDSGNNTLASLFPAPVDGSQFFKYDGTKYTAYTYDALTPGWLPDGNATLNPGEGGFWQNNDTAPATLTFVGEVKQGTLTVNLPAGYAIRASIVPQEASLHTLGVPEVDGDQVFVYSGTKFDAYTYDGLTPGWTPGDVNGPTIKVGQSFFVRSAASHDWVRNFTVQ